MVLDQPAISVTSIQTDYKTNRLQTEAQRWPPLTMASLQIVDAIQQIMDENGSLNVLRSEMASSVLRILQGKRKEKGGNQSSTRAKEYLVSKDGEYMSLDSVGYVPKMPSFKLVSVSYNFFLLHHPHLHLLLSARIIYVIGEIVIGLVRDLLSCLELNHTLRLFDTECELSSDDYTRSKTSEKLSMSIGISGGQAPLIDEVVKSYQDSSGRASPVMSRRTDRSPSPSTMMENDKLKVVSHRAKSPALSDDSSKERQSPPPIVPSPTNDSKLNLGYRRAVNLTISPGKDESVSTSGTKLQSPKNSPLGLTPVSISPSAADAMQRSGFSSLPDLDSRSRIGHDLAPISLTSSSTSAKNSPGGSPPDGKISPAKKQQEISVDEVLEESVNSMSASFEESNEISGEVTGTGNLRKARDPLSARNANVVEVTSKRNARSTAEVSRTSGGSMMRKKTGWDGAAGADDDVFADGEQSNSSSPSATQIDTNRGLPLSPLITSDNKPASPTNTSPAYKSAEDLENSYDDDEFEEIDEDIEELEMSGESPSRRSGGSSGLSRTKSGFIEKSVYGNPKANGDDNDSEGADMSDEFEIEHDDDVGVVHKPTKGDNSPNLKKGGNSDWAFTKAGSARLDKTQKSTESNFSLQDMEGSIASDDIEGMENSDSYSFLNESIGSMSKSKSPKKRLETSDRSELLEFSVTEQELSSSGQGLDQYDHVTNATLPPLKRK